MTSREQAHEYLAHTMRLPDWYGKNLDALEDCLGQFGRETVIILMNSDALRENLGEYGGYMIDVLREQSEHPYSYTFVCK